MIDFVYCGTDPPVGAIGTQQLLEGPFKAIWCPPLRLPAEPSAGDRVWLIWRASPASHPVLLGGGRVVATEEGRGLWTNRTLEGVRQAAQGLGYGGPTNMAFLHLSGAKVLQNPPTVNLGAIAAGLNFAAPQQVQSLELLLRIR